MDYGPPKKVTSARQNRSLRNHRATRPTVVVCGGASPERSYRTVGITKPRSGVGGAFGPPDGVAGQSPRLPFYRRSESASHIGAPPRLTPGGHVSLSHTGGGASGPSSLVALLQDYAVIGSAWGPPSSGT
jgi:hypothetical protein